MSEPDSELENPKPANQATYRTPRWVIVTGVAVLVLVFLVVVVLATGLGGEHGPQRHEPAVTYFVA